MVPLSQGDAMPTFSAIKGFLVVMELGEGK
jgi:hypothetical protein